METAPQIGTHNACASGKTTGEGNRIRFPKQIQGDARVAEHAVGMTENCAVFRAECVKKLLQFFRADLPVNSLFRRESVLVEQQPRKRIIVRIVTRKRRDRKRFRLAADQLRSFSAETPSVCATSSGENFSSLCSRCTCFTRCISSLGSAITPTFASK